MLYFKKESTCGCFVCRFVHIIIHFNLFLPILGKSESGSGHSSITLFQGPKRFELDAKDCPVGIAFRQPEFFSCACVTGIWAFYNNPCNSPIAIIGGDHHCFQMPAEAITLATIVSNPLRGLGESITAFDGDMEAIRSKIYRNLHINLNDADKFVTLNSSWTLISPDQSKSICLDNENVVFTGLSSAERDALPDLSYCSFVDVSPEMPFIGSVKKGCNSSMVLEPLQCQPMLPATDETSVCLDEKVIASYYERFENFSIIDPISDYEDSDSDTDSDFPRLSRALQSLGRFYQKKRHANDSKKILEDIGPKFASAYFGEPEWHQRWAASKGADYFAKNNETQQVTSTAEKVAEINIDELWKDPTLFLSAIPGKDVAASGEENPLMTNHLWIHYRYAIRNVLNITRLVPPDENMMVQLKAGRIKKLLRMHADIMKRICPLAPHSFYETVIGTFMSVLTKGFRWKEPYLEQTHYLRILTSLTTCKNTAETMKFVNAESKECPMKGASYITLPDKEKVGTVNVRLEIPEIFQSDKFEPIIESVWKTFVSVHSYCYKDFSDQYQDHHRYTTLMMGLFSNQLHDIWARNKSMALEYSGVMGNLKEILKNLDSCAMGARMTSDYPFHLNRPSKMSKYHEDDETNSGNRRRKREAASKNENEEETSASGNIPHIRKKRLAAHVVTNENNGADRNLFEGKGICLKRYGETRTIAGSNCKENNK